MKIFLSGYMGSGKSAVGKLLAEKMKLPYLDLDDEISKAEGQSIPDIFKSSGEIYFRRKEAEILKQLLTGMEQFVISLGGGTPCYGKNLQLMKDAEAVTLIYLKTGLEVLKKRLYSEREQRPLLAHLKTPAELEDFIRKHLFERTFYYNQSDVIISTDGKNPDEVAAEIETQLY